MCEIEKQMNTILAGSKPTAVTKSIKVLAMDLDKKFTGIDEKLDLILQTVQENKADTDKKFEDLKKAGNLQCEAHKATIDKELAKIKFMTVLTEQPWIPKLIGIMVVVVVLATLGYNVFEWTLKTFIVK